MTKIEKDHARGRVVLRWLFAAALVAAAVASGLFSGLRHEAGLFYLVAGSVAAALMGFTLREIGTAFGQAAGKPGRREETARSAYFWEAAARNAWILGVLGSTLNFTLALSSESGGIPQISNRMIQSLLVTLYGLVLAVVCLIPAMKLAGRVPAALSSDGIERRPARSALLQRLTGYILFAAVLGATLALLVRGYPQSGRLPLAKVLLHGPSILVVFGGAIAIALFMGTGAGARALTLGFGMTGLVGLLTGLIQALFGFAHGSLPEIVSAIAFIISSASFALIGLGVVAAPLEDREVMEGRRAGAAPSSRMFWILLPLLSFIFLILTFVMVVTPMTKPG
jgi:hypothetical protein